MILMIVCSLIYSSSVFAAQNMLICPSTLTCNYDTGRCEMPAGQWTLDSGAALEPFSGSQTMSASKIWAYKQGSPPNEAYQFECTYKYGTRSSISIYTYVKDLIGDNWIFSGFGKQKADCSEITAPATCAGQN
jgi:hypothetical protein